MTARKWRWVTRDEFSDLVDVWAKYTKPLKCGSNYIADNYAIVCHKEFERMFGITIKPGDCVKVEFTAKVVRDA